MHRYLPWILVQGNHPGAVSNTGSERRQECLRQMVCSTGYLNHVGIVISAVLAEKFEERRIHHRFLVIEQSEHFDHAFRPALELQEFTHGVLVVFAVNLFPGRLPVFLDLLDQRSNRLFPEITGKTSFFTGMGFEAK